MEVQYRSQEQRDVLDFLTVQNAAGSGKLSAPISITPLYAFWVFHHFKAECQQLQCETQKKSTNMGSNEHQRHGLCMLCKLLFSYETSSRGPASFPRKNKTAFSEATGGNLVFDSTTFSCSMEHVEDLEWNITLLCLQEIPSVLNGTQLWGGRERKKKKRKEQELA